MSLPGSPGRRTLLAALAAASLWPCAAMAYRPFDSTDAAVAGRDELELELQPIGWEGGAAGRSLASSVVVNWGVAHRLELVLEGKHALALGDPEAGQRSRREEGAVGVKAVLREGALQGATGPSVAAELSAIAPGAGEGVGAQGALLVSRRLGVGTAHLNGRGTWTRAEGLQLGGGLIVEGPDPWALRPVAELLAEGPRRRSALLGAIWRLREGLSLDAAVRGGREGPGRVIELRAGVTWAFPWVPARE